MYKYNPDRLPQGELVATYFIVLIRCKTIFISLYHELLKSAMVLFIGTVKIILNVSFVQNIPE